MNMSMAKPQCTVIVGKRKLLVTRKRFETSSFTVKNTCQDGEDGEWDIEV